jgi:hypothetical protein
MRLLRAAFEWARAARPSQPLSSGIWLEPVDSFFAGFVQADPESSDAPPLAERLPLLNETLIELSDVITFHSYLGAGETQQRIDRLAATGRPVICTEWMGRSIDSTIDTHLPVFMGSEPAVGCYMWGLVNGRTQTHIHGDWDPAAPYTGIWHHDLFWPDGTPYDPSEIEALRKASGTAARR